MTTTVDARLDTVGLSFPIVDADTVGATVSVTQYGTQAEKVTYRRSLPTGGFVAWGIGGSAWVEASLPKRVGDHNVDGLLLADAMDVMRDLYNEARQFVEPGRTDRGGLAVDPRATQRVRCEAERAVIGPVPAPDEVWPIHRPNHPAALHGPGLDGMVSVHDVFWADHDSMPGDRWTFDDCRVKRLDLVRDFDDVSAIGPLLDGLAMVKQPGRSKVKRYADAQASMAETLKVGPKSWSATLYDKHAESGGEAQQNRWLEACRRAKAEGRPTPLPPHMVCPKGRLRYELRARDELLNGVMMKQATGREIRTVRDLDEIPLRVVTEKMFKHVGFDREVSGLGAAAARINDSDLTARQKRELVSYLFGRAAGVDLAWSSNTERKYRNLAAGLGIVIGAGALDETFRASLDYASGVEVVAA